MGEANASRGGRPKGRYNPNILWELAERLYVEGTVHGGIREYPSAAEIAAASGTSKGNIMQRARRYNWPQKRQQFALANPVIHGELPALSEVNTLPNPAKKSRRNAEEILTAYIDKFAHAVETNSVRHDTVADLDKAVRLLAFVRGEADQRKQTHVVVTLETLQTRHRQMKERVGRIDDGVAGVIGHGSGATIEAQFEVVPEAPEAPEANAGQAVQQHHAISSQAAGEVSAKPATSRARARGGARETNTASAWELAAARAATGTDDDE